MPIVRSSFTPHGQNFKIPKIDFCDVITSVLYTRLHKIIIAEHKINNKVVASSPLIMEKKYLHLQVVQSIC